MVQCNYISCNFFHKCDSRLWRKIIVLIILVINLYREAGKFLRVRIVNNNHRTAVQIDRCRSCKIVPTIVSVGLNVQRSRLNEFTHMSKSVIVYFAPDWTAIGWDGNHRSTYRATSHSRCLQYEFKILKILCSYVKNIFLNSGRNFPLHLKVSLIEIFLILSNVFEENVCYLTQWNTYVASVLKQKMYSLICS